MEAKSLLSFSRTIFVKTTIRFFFFSRTVFFLIFIMATIKRLFGEKYQSRAAPGNISFPITSGKKSKSRRKSGGA